MPLFRVRQKGNRVELHGGSEVVWYEVSGIRLPELTDHGFALWHLLASAVSEGFDVELDGPVADETLENARLFTRMWELWQPTRFREVRVGTRGGSPGPRPRERLPELSLFSAGVDSTTMLLRRGVRPERSTALTVHGMDYFCDEESGFASLLERSAAFLEQQNYSQITLRSNAARIASGHHAWGLALAGYSFLFADVFEKAYLAADEPWEIDMMIHPWGLNHVTNRLFRGGGFVLDRIMDDISRSQKLAIVAADPVALRAITFCKRRDLRPNNCGVCQKCVRTKAMLLGMTGSIPDIFLDRRLTPTMVRKSFHESAITAANLHDLFIRSRGLGPNHEVPGLADVVARDRRWQRLRQGLTGGLPRPWKRRQPFVPKG